MPLYVKPVPIPVRSASSSIVFGTPGIGYFETKNRKHLPPTYLEPIEYFENHQGLHCLSRKKYSNPTPKEHTISTFSLKGSPASAFFLTNGYTPFEPADTQEPKGHSVVFVLNRLGETVWSYSPDKERPSSDHRTRSVLAKVIDGNVIGLLRSYERSYFERVDWEGNVLQSFNPTPTVFHHDFLMDANDQVLTLSNSMRSVRKPWFFWRKPITFLGSPLIRYTPEAKTATTVWDYLDFQNPFSDNGWTWNATDSGSAYSNFTHANSLDQNSQGYLLSLRNVSKVVLVDRVTLKPLWKIDSRTLGIYRQHHATFLKDGTILLFDNSTNSSRVLKIDTSASPKILSEFDPSPPVHSSRHGSAFAVSGGKITGFFPNTTPGSKEPNRIIEFDEASGKELARLEYRFGYDAAGYRAQPLNEILGAHPYKGEVPPCKIR